MRNRELSTRSFIAINPIWLKVKLLLLIFFTSFFAFLDSWTTASIAFSFALFTLILLKEFKYKALLFYMVVVNALFMFFGNWIFSPEDQGSYEFLIFNFNDAGAILGLVGLLKRSAMIILSFAWLSSINSFYEVFHSVNYFGKLNRIVLIFLRQFQILSKEFIFLYYALTLKNFNLKSINPRHKLKQLKLFLIALMNKVFRSVGKLTYNGESHFQSSSKHHLSEKGLRLKNLTSAYDGSVAVSNVSLSFNIGETVLICGTNCSGKSTLLKVMSGYIDRIQGEIEHGDIYINGNNIKNFGSIRELSKHLRFLIDNPSDAILGLNTNQELSLQSLEPDIISSNINLLNLQEYLNQDINTLSGGEQMRAALASILCSQVKIVLLDSPLNQLDNKGRRAFVTAVKKISQTGKHLIIIADQFVDPYIEIVNRVIVLNQGTVSGDYHDLKKLPEALSLKSTYKKASQMIKGGGRLDNEYLLSLENICLKLNERTILRDINFGVRAGQVVSIVGDNGSGKTTLCLILANLIKASSGQINYNRELKIGMLFQDCNLQVLENAVLDELTIDGLSETEGFWSKKKSAAHRLSNLKDDDCLLDKSSSEIKLLEIVNYSFGKDIIIFDEPTNGLDESNVIKLISYIEDLKKAGCVVIYITHDMKFASFADRYLLMHDAKLVSDSTEFEDIIAKRKILDIEYDPRVS